MEGRTDITQNHMTDDQNGEGQLLVMRHEVNVRDFSQEHGAALLLVWLRLQTGGSNMGFSCISFATTSCAGGRRFKSSPRHTKYRNSGLSLSLSLSL